MTGPIRSLIVAALLIVLISAPVAAQSRPITQLGTWILSQPQSVLISIGCNYQPPYATYCWQHIVRKDQIVETIHYRQGNGHIIMWRTRSR
jgi:hypothetical protein